MAFITSTLLMRKMRLRELRSCPEVPQLEVVELGFKPRWLLTPEPTVLPLQDLPLSQ